MKANTLNLACKGLAAALALAAGITKIAGFDFDMGAVLAASGVLAATFVSVDISKIKTS